MIAIVNETHRSIESWSDFSFVRFLKRSGISSGMTSSWLSLILISLKLLARYPIWRTAATLWQVACAHCGLQGKSVPDEHAGLSSMARNQSRYESIRLRSNLINTNRNVFELTLALQRSCVVATASWTASKLLTPRLLLHGHCLRRSTTWPYRCFMPEHDRRWVFLV